MDNEAIALVLDYISGKWGFSYDDFDVYIVWKCKVLQNWKYLISTTMADGMYYELTFNGDKCEWYLDAYRKYENVCVKRGERYEHI